ncbi:MAG: hypothetical protein BWY63_00813 [Chloroflexi bacterium ADurb.Bin360]|nr:MAG: hypothetical protein BWY63_00813 [Chloroflexi bacterium ADurb.Bin360]
MGDTPCSGSLTQTSSGKHRLVLAQIPCEYNNPSNKCTVVNPIASEVTNSNPPLELNPVYFDPPNWSGWQYTTLRNTSWGSGSCVAPNEDKCLNDQEFKNIGLNDIYGVGTTQFWYFNITLRTCTTKSASFELKNLPTGVETRRVSQFLTPHNLRSPFGEQYYNQVVAVPIPLKPCVKNCTCESSTCIGSSCGDWCGGQCTGTLAPSCNYSAWSPATCSPACGQTQTRTPTPICLDASECTQTSQTCSTSDCGDPSAPTNLQVDGNSSGNDIDNPIVVSGSTVNLTWGNPVNQNGFDKFRLSVFNNNSGLTFNDDNIDKTVFSYVFPAGSSGSLTAGHKYRWQMYAYDQDNCASLGSCSTDDGLSDTSVAKWFCQEGESCSLKCGQIKNCGGNCESTDDGVPVAPSIVSPAGLSSSPTVYNNVNSTTLSWNSVLTLTDRYEVVVVVDGVGTTVLNNTSVSPDSVSNLSSGSLNYNTVYRWHIRAVNTTCGTDYSSWSSWGYFRFNRTPPSSGSPSSSLVLRNSNSIVVPVETGNRNQICQTAFMSGGNHDRRARVEIRAVDLDGYDDIENVYFRLGVGNSVAVTNLTTSPLSASTGNWSLYDSVTYSGADTTRVVTFPVEFGAGMNASSLYGMEMKIDDRWGQSSGWVSADRSFKVWNCLVPLSGSLYDSSDVGGAICLNGTGYSQVYEGSLFTSLVYRQDGGSPIVSPTISGADFSGANLIWGQEYAEIRFILSSSASICVHQRPRLLPPHPGCAPATPSAHTPPEDRAAVSRELPAPHRMPPGNA